MNRSLACVAVFLGASVAPTFPAGAQTPGTHAFFPLELGNRWIHQNTRETPHYRTMEVVGTDIIDDEAVWVLSVEISPFDGSIGSSGLCAVRFTSEEELVSTALEGSADLCDLLYSDPGPTPDLSAPFAPDRVVVHAISGTEVTLLTRSLWPVGTSRYLVLGEGVGLISAAAHTAYSPMRYPMAYLVYALVGGVQYGRKPDTFNWKPFFALSLGNQWIWRNDHWSLHTGITTITFIHDNIVDIGEGDNVTTFTIYRRTVTTEGELLNERNCIYEFRAIGSAVGSGSCGSMPMSIGEYIHTFRHFGTMKHDSEYGGRLSNTFFWNAESGQNTETWAHGLGQVHQKRSSYGGPGSTHNSSVTQLVWARIDGIEWGSYPSIGQEGPMVDEPATFHVFPNPVRRGDALVAQVVHGEGEVIITVIDLLGRVAMRLEVDVTGEGDASVNLDASSLAPGVYIVRVVTGSNAVAQTLTVIR